MFQLFVACNKTMIFFTSFLQIALDFVKNLIVAFWDLMLRDTKQKM